MQITREYLEQRRADLERQAQEASVTLAQAQGAIATVQHLLSVLDQPEQPPAPAPSGQPSGA